MPHSFRDLIAWQRSMALARQALSLALRLRQVRHFGAAAQLENAAISVPSNIAEGHGRGTPREFARFLSIALGSLREVETLISLAADLGAADDEVTAALLSAADEAGKVIHGLRRSLRDSAPGNRPPQPPAVS